MRLQADPVHGLWRARGGLPRGRQRGSRVPQCGVLAGSSSEWLAAFRQLAADAGRRARLGSAGRRWVKERYSLRSALPALAGVIRRAAAASSRHPHAH